MFSHVARVSERQALQYHLHLYITFHSERGRADYRLPWIEESLQPPQKCSHPQERDVAGV